VIDDATRAAHSHLPVRELSLEADCDVHRFTRAILHRERVDRARNVGVSAIGSEDGAANDGAADRTREGRDPTERALPRHLGTGEVTRRLSDAERWPQQRWPAPLEEIRAPRELDRRA
jgi:hypothetical protein